MIDVLASEWLKISTVRSTRSIIAVALATVVLGALMVRLGVQGWDKLPPARRVHFQAAPMEQIILPGAQFALAVLGALSITSEFSTRMIRTSVIAVPSRRTLITAKALVVATVALVTGLAVELAMFFAGRLIVGGRPIPGNTGSVSDQIPRVLSLGISVMVVALVGLGLGCALRSTAGALSGLAVLLFVLPTLAHFLPAPWSGRLSSVLFSDLPLQLAHAASSAVLSPPGALAVMASYILAALGGGMLLITRRDV